MGVNIEWTTTNGSQHKLNVRDAYALEVAKSVWRQAPLRMRAYPSGPGGTIYEWHWSGPHKDEG